MRSILEARKSASHGTWLRFAGLCAAGAVALCLASSARAETWWAGLGNAGNYQATVHQWVPHKLQICLTGKTMKTQFGYFVQNVVPGATVNVRLVWGPNSPSPGSTEPFPKPGPKFATTDTFVKLPGPGPDGHYCDQGITVKYSEFPTIVPYDMRGYVQGIGVSDLLLFDVMWIPVGGTATVGNPASKITSVRPRMLGDTRPTFTAPSNGQKFIGTNVTLGLTSHVGSWFCARGHYELDWQRGQLLDSPSGFPKAMAEWAAGPKPNLPCNAAGPAMATVPFATLSSRTTEYHYEYLVRARIVGTGFQGAWSPWRKFYVEEPPLRRMPASGLLRGPVHMGTPSH